MKYKIAVCDDDPSQIAYLKDIVATWTGKQRHLAEIKTYPTAEAFLFDWETEKDFDILLLDIEMSGLSGIDLAKTVRRENSTMQIIFITGYYEYFSDGFDVSALHYLIKPATPVKLYPVLDKAVTNLAYRQRAVLLVTSEGDVKIALSDIVYVESENVYVTVHTTQGSFRSRMTLARCIEQLDDTFFKVHRSFVVGLKYVKMIARNEVTMVTGDKVPMSRGMYDTVHAALIRYL